MWGMGQRGDNTAETCLALAPFLVTSPLPVYNWHPSSCPSGCSQSRWVYIHSRARRPFKPPLPKDQQFIPLPQPPPVFTASSYESSSFWCWNPGLCGLAGAGIAHSQGIHPNFINHMWMWDCPVPPVISLPLPHYHHTMSSQPQIPSPPLLPIWMNVASLHFWGLDFHTVQHSGSSGYFLFWG